MQPDSQPDQQEPINTVTTEVVDPGSPPTQPNLAERLPDPTYPAMDEAPIIPQKPPRSKKKILIISAIILLILAVAGAAVYWFVLRDNTQPAATTNTSQTDQTAADTQEPTVTPTPVVVLKAEEVAVSNLQMSEKPVADDSKPLFTNMTFLNEPDCGQPSRSTCSTTDEVGYYKIAQTADGGTLYIAVLPQKFIDTPPVVLYSVGKDGTYTLYTSETLLGVYPISYEIYKVSIQTGTVEDKKSVFTQLQFPEKSVAGNQNVRVSEPVGAMGTLLVDGLASIKGKTTKLGEKDGVTFYSELTRAEEGFDVKVFHAVKYGFLEKIYVSDGELASTEDKIKIAWNGGDNNESAYRSAAQGCGASSAYMAASGITKADLLPVGKSPKGQTIYALPLTSVLFKSVYTKDYQAGQSVLQDATLTNLSEADFQSKHGAIVVEDGNNELILFLRSDMFIRGGCAKPVVYLYPTHTSLVDVSVGADVTIADPLYPQGGWRNVLAQPDGSLLYNGQSYTSLFWEGYGYGEYPDKTGVGVVVPTDQAAATIRQHLIAQGLQGREITDFMAFWEPRLPQTAYTRITWLSTAELNRLAPLSINPLADTTIRVFLDFEGMDTYQSLHPQTFKAPTRTGFTVVEWGGLARNGLSAL